jgi:ABC-type polysaccharide/polyol phosphate export permease
LSMVPDNLKPLMYINPLASLIESWRRLFMENTLPGFDLWVSVGFAALALAIGGGAFRRLEGGFADAL